jgi:lysophospholipase L1-like esterase
MRLVAIGDSTVEGIEDPGPDGSYVGWADRLARHLSDAVPDLLYANLAVRGQTSAEVRATQLGPALALEPDVAVVVAGVNNLLRPRLDRVALREDLMAMHAAFAAAGARVVTFTMPDMSQVAPIIRVLRGRVDFLNAVTRDCAECYGSLVLDLAAEPTASHPACWHSDRLHANSEGHRRVALGLAELLGYPVGGAGNDWRAPLPAVPEPRRGAVVAGEARWVLGHLLPWAWDHLRGAAEPPVERTCKRPELGPVVMTPL